MTVEALNCPNCGAGVASDSTRCEFCKTRLKTVGCPSCLGLMFEGSRFCGHCGAQAVAAEVAGGDAPGECPRCCMSFDLLQIAGTHLRECQNCGGIWADVETFETICADRERQSAVLVFAAKRELRPQPLNKIRYLPCPDCKQLMNRSNFARASGVIIDTCRQHGVWFDPEELQKIIEFIQKGGMEIARGREKRELDEQRAALRDERRRLGIQSQNLDDEFARDEGSGIRWFIDKLFD